MGQGNFPRRHYPDRVLGYLLSPTAWSTPVSIIRLKHFTGRFANEASHSIIRRRCPAKRLGAQVFKKSAIGQLRQDLFDCGNRLDWDQAAAEVKARLR